MDVCPTRVKRYEVVAFYLFSKARIRKMNKEITETKALEEFSVVELEQRVEFGLCGGSGGGDGGGGPSDPPGSGCGPEGASCEER